MKEVVHPTGLILRVAEQLPVEERPDGFFVYPNPPIRVRGSAEVTVRLYGNDFQPEGDYPEQQRIGERLIHYREHESVAGGSGGSDFEFSAWEICPSGYITYQQRYQRKYGEKDFTLSWHVIEGTKVQKR